VHTSASIKCKPTDNWLDIPQENEYHKDEGNTAALYTGNSGSNLGLEIAIMTEVDAEGFLSPARRMPHFVSQIMLQPHTSTLFVTQYSLLILPFDVTYANY
jgi:hypothetical protein